MATQSPKRPGSPAQPSLQTKKPRTDFNNMNIGTHSESSALVNIKEPIEELSHTEMNWAQHYPWAKKNQEDAFKVDPKLELHAGVNDFHDMRFFSAPIKVNGRRIGNLTREKLELEVKSVTDMTGVQVPISKLGKRILRIGGRDIGRDGFQITLPRTACDAVTITFTAQGCKGVADNQVFFQELRNVTAEEQSLVATVARIEADRKAKVVITDNEWHDLYLEWRNWTTLRLENTCKMKRFPRMPEKVRRCQLADCSRIMPNGKRREFRWIDHCRHDIERWFHDAAGGYNAAYYEIIKYEEAKWQPTQFRATAGDLSERQQKFRWMAGEMWKHASALVQKYELDGGGLLP